MVQLRTAISIGEAITRVMTDSKNQPTETIDLNECANRFLAEDLIANEHVPAFDRALYDGYAIRAEDTMEATHTKPIVFEVIGEIGAGSIFSSTVNAFQAVRIMTGAEIPASCNAVIMLEDVEQFTEDHVQKIRITQVVSNGERVFAKGTEIRQGACIASKGTQINPGVIGLLATFGFHQVNVRKKPIVGILATGSELLEVDEPLLPGKIRNSNSYMLLSQVVQAGGEAVYLGKLEDDLEKSIQVIQEALQRVDILVTTGGVSVGDYDYLPAIYERLGATVLFNKIAMRPGSVTTVAKLAEQYLVGLSGNPSASFIGFELFVRPLIRKRLGNPYPHLLSAQAVLADDYPNANNFTQLIRTKCVFENGHIVVGSNGLNMSNAITSIAGADALAILRPTQTGNQKGEMIDILLLSAEKGQQHSVFGGDEDA